MDTYDNYLNEPKSLPVEQMRQLHLEMVEEIGTDADALELYGQLLAVAVAYAGIRAQWPLLSREEKMERDSSRTSKHDSLIIHFNMLSRYLKMQGRKAGWRDALGDPDSDRYSRKAMGDFGCYLAFVNSICAR